MMSDQDILNSSILIVDDQQANITLLSEVMAEAGYRNVESTMDPTVVCEIHRRNRFDLILLDLQMPVIDGFQLMESLKTSLTDPYLPVIVLTAQPGHKRKALLMGARDFISKPFDLMEVRTRIRNMLEVRLLHKQLELYSESLEKLVEERTAELRESEARYRSLTELATDWYWEQDEAGNFTKVSGAVMEMLGIQVAGFSDGTGSNREETQFVTGSEALGWKPAERLRLQQMIAARVPFLDFMLTRTMPDGTQRRYQVSGEPMFNQACRFIGYRGIGLEIIGTKLAADPRT